MKCEQVGSNYFFIDHEGSKYCFSYGENVASLINDMYVEYDGEKYHSATSNKHKAKFRKYYNINK